MIITSVFGTIDYYGNFFADVPVVDEDVRHCGNYGVVLLPIVQQYCFHTTKITENSRDQSSVLNPA